jgi:hypothetical protein
MSHALPLAAYLQVQLPALRWTEKKTSNSVVQLERIAKHRSFQ